MAAQRISPARSTLKRELAVREARLQRVVRRALAGLRAIISQQDLRHGALLGSMPATTSAELDREWEQHRAAMVEALIAPIRLQRADPGLPLSQFGTSAEQLAMRQIGELIREIGPRQLLAVRQQIAALIDLGPRPEILRAIADATGLTQRQTAAVQRFLATQLEAGNSPAVVSNAASNYADRLLGQRAALIARHESVDFTNQLILERARGAASGEGGQVTKSSVSARDANVDAGDPEGICATLDNGERIPVDQPFVFEGESFDGPPYHVGCRCLLEIWRES